MQIEDIILYKINLFMKKYILNVINPSKVYWWISVSGGKDSYSLALAIFLWYRKNNYAFNGEGIFINQWNKIDIYQYLRNKIDWMPIVIIDAVAQTARNTNYKLGDQAPCSKCSQVRKDVGDQYILEHYKDGYYNVLAKGLHLTDMAISYLWRNFWRLDIETFARKLEKGNPFVKINSDKEIYLSKPLFAVREYECEIFSKVYKYDAICCGCPACAFPSRRDIVEESIRLLFDDELWELSVQGINIYLERIGVEENIHDISLRGKESKVSHLTSEFVEFALGYWKAIENNCKIAFDNSTYLDKIGTNFLVNGNQYWGDTIFKPKFFTDAELNEKEKVMIATVGPFWGAIGYADSSKRDYILQMQFDMYNVKIDKLWSQVNNLFKLYYKGKGMNYEKSNRTDFICNCNLLNNNFGGYSDI